VETVGGELLPRICHWSHRAGNVDTRREKSAARPGGESLYSMLLVAGMTSLRGKRRADPKEIAGTWGIRSVPPAEAPVPGCDQECAASGKEEKQRPQHVRERRRQ